MRTVPDIFIGPRSIPGAYGLLIPESRNTYWGWLIGILLIVTALFFGKYIQSGMSHTLPGYLKAELIASWRLDPGDYS